MRALLSLFGAVQKMPPVLKKRRQTRLCIREEFSGTVFFLFLFVSIGLSYLRYYLTNQTIRQLFFRIDILMCQIPQVYKIATRRERDIHSYGITITHCRYDIKILCVYNFKFYGLGKKTKDIT